MDIENLTFTNGLTFSADNEIIDISWVTTQSGMNPTCPQPGGWVVTDDERSSKLIFNVQDSLNCGGCNGNIQSGTATATFAVGQSPYWLYYSLNGQGEPEAQGFELMEFKISGGAYANTLLVDAQAPGGNLGCAASKPAIINELVPSPITLERNTNYTFVVNFTTNDNLFHVGAFYECVLNFIRKY